MTTGSTDDGLRTGRVSHVAYESPQALDAAVKDRVAVAALTSPYSITEIRRHLAYDRFLARVFLDDPESWVLKGGTGLLARIPAVAVTQQTLISSAKQTHPTSWVILPRLVTSTSGISSRSTLRRPQN